MQVALGFENQVRLNIALGDQEAMKECTGDSLAEHGIKNTAGSFVNTCAGSTGPGEPVAKEEEDEQLVLHSLLMAGTEGDSPTQWKLWQIILLPCIYCYSPEQEDAYRASKSIRRLWGITAISCLTALLAANRFFRVLVSDSNSRLLVNVDILFVGSTSLLGLAAIIGPLGWIRIRVSSNAVQHRGPLRLLAGALIFTTNAATSLWVMNLCTTKHATEDMRIETTVAAWLLAFFLPMVVAIPFHLCAWETLPWVTLNATVIGRTMGMGLTAAMAFVAAATILLLIDYMGRSEFEAQIEGTRHILTIGQLQTERKDRELSIAHIEVEKADQALAIVHLEAEKTQQALFIARMEAMKAEQALSIAHMEAENKEHELAAEVLRNKIKERELEHQLEQQRVCSFNPIDPSF